MKTDLSNLYYSSTLQQGPFEPLDVPTNRTRKDLVIQKIGLGLSNDFEYHFFPSRLHNGVRLQATIMIDEDDITNDESIEILQN